MAWVGGRNKAGGDPHPIRGPLEGLLGGQERIEEDKKGRCCWVVGQVH